MTQCYNVTLLQREGHCNLEYAQTKLNIKLLLNLDQHLQQSQQVRKCMHRITSLPRSIAFVIHSKTAILRNCIWISNNVCIISPSQLQVQAFFCSDKYLADDASDASKKKNACLRLRNMLLVSDFTQKLQNIDRFQKIRQSQIPCNSAQRLSSSLRKG